MSEYVIQFASTAVVMVPTVFSVHWLARMALSAAGAMRLDRPYCARDMRTWPRGAFILHTSLFALLLTACATADLDRDSSIYLGAAATALVTGGIAPRVIRVRRATKAPSQ